MRALWALAVVWGLEPVACVPHVPLPPPGLHGPGDDFAIVPYPPPPAQLEEVPPPPGAAAVWIDGEWRWTGADYAWRAGGWANAPAPGATYAPATAVRGQDGTLTYFPGRWHAPDGTPLGSKEP